MKHLPSPTQVSWAPPCASRGFTLTEMLTVVAIAAVLAAAAIPSLSGAIERSRLKSAAEAIASDLDLARLETAKRNTNLQVTVQAGGNWCYGVHTGPCDCTVAGSCSVKSVSAADIGRGISVQGEGVAFTTTFSRVRGTAASGGVTLVSDGGEALRVMVSTRGRVRICSPEQVVSGYDPC